MNAALAQYSAPIQGGFALGTRHQNGQMAFRLAADVQGLGRAGEVITLAVTPADVTNQTEELETYLGGYRPFGFGADLLSKVVLVDKEAGTRRDFSKENAFEEVEVRTGRHGPIKEVDHLSETAPYRVEDYGLATFIPFAAQNDAHVLYDVRASAGEMISWKLAIAREVRTITLLTTLANWDAANRTTLTTNFKWDNGSTKDPLFDLHARIKASAQVVTDVAMNPDVAFWFLSDAKVRDFMKQMLGDNAPTPAVAAAAVGAQGVQTFQIPSLPPIHILPAKRLVAGALEYILADDVVLVTNQPGVPRDGNGVASSWTFRYRGRSGTGIQTNEYIPLGRGINGGTMFDMGYSDDQFMGSAIAGGLIKDVLS